MKLKKLNSKTIIYLSSTLLLLALVFVLSQMVLAKNGTGNFIIRDSYIEVIETDYPKEISLVKKENGKEEIAGQVKIVDQYLISDLPENEFLDEYSYLKGGFQDLTISLETDQPLFDKENFYYSPSLLDKTKVLFDLATLPEYRITKEIDKSASVQTELDLKNLKIGTHYEELGIENNELRIKQTLTFTNESDQDLNLALLLKNQVEANKIYWNNQEYFITENARKFVNPDKVSFGKAFYDFSDIPDEFEPELWAENKDGQPLLILSLNVSISAGETKIIDPTYGVEIIILNVHSHPQVGDNWTVSFETTGTADLTITPDDQVSIDDLDFVSLKCGDQERVPQILENDVIFYPNWFCEGTVEIIHLVNVARAHVLKFQFGDQIAYAYNSPEFPTVAAVSTGEKTSNDTSHTVQLPSGIASGNLLLVFLASDGSPTITVTTPGWTQLFETVYGSPAVTFGAWYRIADGGEGATITVTTSVLEWTVHTSYRITGYSGVPEVGTSVTGNTTTPDPPSLTPSWGAEDTLWLALLGYDMGLNTTISAYPTNYTDGSNDYVINSSDNGTAIGIARRELNAVSEDPGTFTIPDTYATVANTMAIGPVPANTAPTVSSVTFNNGSDLTLTPDSTTEVKAQATVTDAQDCTTISTVEAKIYRSGATSGKDCTVDKNDCYSVVTCTVVTSGNTCTGAGDTSADYECTINMEYYADPTDAGVYSAENWMAWVKATDSGSLTGNAYSPTGTLPDVKTQLAFSLSTASINYGTMSLGTNTGITNQTVNIINTGNVQMDVMFDGYGAVDGDGKAMVCNPGSIDIGNEKYGISDVTYASLGWALTDTATEQDWDVLQRTVDSAKTQGQDQKWSYWGFAIPASGVGGSCSGYVTFTAVNDAGGD